MQLEDERRHADQYKEQNEKVTKYLFIRRTCHSMRGTGTGAQDFSYSCVGNTYLLVLV
jgi:hypothetical protein